MASAVEPCPAPEVLESLAVGAATTSAVRDHLTLCEACQHALQRIREDNRFLRGFLSSGAVTPSTPATLNPTINIPGYQIIREIHRGGQGVVYQAVQRSTSRHVAIKVMKQGPFATLADRARFDREIETLAKLDHPNIVTVHDAGVVAGLQYFVMNYVEGRALDEVLPAVQSESPEPASDAQARLAKILTTFIKVCEAVHDAHLRGVIHRDLKPSNIRVDPAGEPHILDFGLAKSLNAEGESAMTHTGQFVGSLPWASPEQVEGASARVDLRTDVYSLGAILYQLLTGVLPFDVSGNLRDAVDSILFREPLPPSVRVSTTGGLRLNDELDTIVLKCLAKDRQRRYQTADELGRDLGRYLAGEAIEAKRDSAVYMLRKTLRRYRLHVAVVGAFVVLVTVFAVVMAVLYRRAAHLEHQAVQAADSLNDLLSQSTVEQGRMAGMLGNMEQAEQLLWRELLTHRAVGGQSHVQLNAPPGPPDAYWGLWELYRRYPCRRTLTPQPPAIRTVMLSDDGQGLWTVDANGLAQKLDEYGAQGDSYQLPFSNPRGLPLTDASGKVVLNFDGQHHAVWQRNAGDRPLLELPNDVESTCLSRSGRHVAAIIDGEAVVWDLDPVAETIRFRGDDADLNAVAFSNDDQRLAVRDRLGGVQIWEISSRRCVARATTAAPGRETLHNMGELLFSPDDSQLADAWADIAGRIWNLRAAPPSAVELAERPGDYRVQGFSPDGRLLAVGDLGGAVRIFDTATGRCRVTFVAHPGRVRSVAFTGDGRGLWTCGEGDLRLWDIDATAGVRVVRIDGESFHSVDSSPAGDWLCAGGGLGRLHRIESSTLAVTSLDFGNEAPISCVTISADGQRIAAATYANSVYLWEGAGLGDPPVRLVHPSRVSYACFSPDGARLATACDDSVVRLWRTADGTLERELPKADDRIPQVAFDATGRQVAVAIRSGALLVWDLDTTACETWSPANQKPLRAVCFSPDGRWLIAAGAERTVAVWDTTRRRRVANLVGHNQEIFCLDISPNGELIASGDTGGAIRLWHAALRRPLATLEGYVGPVMALHFAVDGRKLISASLDGTLRVWDLTYYARHVAGNLEPQLRRLSADQTDPLTATAWRRWATEVPGATGDDPPAQPRQ
jgi:WD40 repeat protein